MLNYAYSLLRTKSVDGDQRTITGVATSPVADRVGDIVEPLGVKFQSPLPLLLYHDHHLPIGHVWFDAPTKDGITFRAKIADVQEPGLLKDRLDLAWQSVKAGLIQGASIGFRALDNGIEQLKSGGLRFLKTEILEMSFVVVPAHQDATILSIKSLDTGRPAASGTPDVSDSVNTPGVTGTPVVRLLPTRSERTMKSLQEQILSYKSTRDQKFQDRDELMTKASEAGVTLDADQEDQYETLDAEIKALDKHLQRLEAQEQYQKASATAVTGATSHEASASRGATPVIHTRQNEEPGIGFARAVLCKTASFLSQGTHSPLDIAKAKFPDNDRLHMFFKASIPAGTTTGVTWAAPFMDPTNLTGEFIEFLRPQTIIGKLNLRNIPFNVRILSQTSGGDAYWVGEGAPKPVTKFDFSAVTHTYNKVASITVITDELARFSNPSAERMVRDSLAAAQTARVDIDLLDPAQAAVAGVNPASLTNGLTAMTPSGTTADAARSDLARIVKTYLDNNNSVAGLALVMPASLALSLSVMRNSLGQREFLDITLAGGSVEGIPTITSQYVANTSGAGNLVVAINQGDVFLSDDGQATVDASREASIQMLDNPTNSSATATATTMVSMWQTNSIALRAERFITWSKARANAVVYMDDVNWGSIGSPA